MRLRIETKILKTSTALAVEERLAISNHTASAMAIHSLVLRLSKERCVVASNMINATQRASPRRFLCGKIETSAPSSLNLGLSTVPVPIMTME
jgi:hypothetical protein